MSKTYLVLGKTGVEKSIFINDISEGKTNLLMKDTKNAVTIELNVAQLIKIEFVINSKIFLAFKFQKVINQI